MHLKTSHLGCLLKELNLLKDDVNSRNRYRSILCFSVLKLIAIGFIYAFSTDNKSFNNICRSLMIPTLILLFIHTIMSAKQNYTRHTLFNTQNANAHAIANMLLKTIQTL